MARIVCGLDMAELKWSKFGSSNMFSADYHRRRTRLIVYQVAMIVGMVSNAVNTAVLTGEWSPTINLAGWSVC